METAPCSCPRKRADREQDLDGEPSWRCREPAMPRRLVHRPDTQYDQGFSVSLEVSSIVYWILALS